MPALHLFDPAAQDEPAETPPIGGAAPTLTGGAVIRRYLEDLEVRRNAGLVTNAHFHNYRRSLAAAPRDDAGNARYVAFADVVATIPGAELIQHNLTEWLRRNPQWVSAETRRNNTAAAIACFNWADEEGLLKPAPYRRSKRLKEKRVRRRDANDLELAKVWDAAPLALRRVLWIIDRIGLRTCEVRVLEFDKHIFWDRAIVRFEAGEHKTGKQLSEPKPRTVGLDAETLAELRRWYDARRNGQKLVFLSQRGRPWSKNNLDKAFRVARAKAGLADDLTPYCFRHRSVTQGRLAGASREEMAQQAGHASPTMTDHYTHLEDKPEHVAAVEANAVANAEKIAAARASKRTGKLSTALSTPLFDGLE